MTKRAGKSKQPSARGALVQIRVTPEEKTAWRVAAEEDRRKLSDWLRLAAEAYMETRKTSVSR